MKILATYSIKGGVGKTASAVNLAHLAARSGARTLVWDLDPQGAATYYFRIKHKVKGGTRGLFGGKRKLDEVIRGADNPNLHVIPSDFSYRNMDLALDGTKGSPVKKLKKLLAPLKKEYDYVFLDCPPSISLVSEAVFNTADWLLVPVIPTVLSQRTLGQLLAFKEKEKLPMRVLPFFSLVDRRKKLHVETMATMRDFDPRPLETPIPYASEVEQMGVQRAPVTTFAPRSRAAVAYRSLWDEVREIVD